MVKTVGFLLRVFYRDEKKREKRKSLSESVALRPSRARKRFHSVTAVSPASVGPGRAPLGTGGRSAVGTVTGSPALLGWCVWGGGGCWGCPSSVPFVCRPSAFWEETKAERG